MPIQPIYKLVSISISYRGRAVLLLLDLGHRVGPSALTKTRKPCYRKGDRAMRPKISNTIGIFVIF